ncbi:hypothetical protein PAMC26510_01635 [Caballeronia sordidicola]|uniref:Uncharacterized protein n=1 Tax=Caballeronia sordidicola TaxID=196367 RepID=A0A242N3R7_CABSO|nr:hypothetical protein PAMC26577_06630 [Caballeronia sordidicola]OTP80318.1 hypothetical protein PAMC26510_01635 [Caballeronia sordidicola]
MGLVQLENAACMTCAQASDRSGSQRLQNPFDEGVPHL